MRYRFFLSVMLAVCILLGILPIARAESAAPLSEEQTNAIAMLNYITVLTQDVNASKNSRLYMEEAYSSLINNTYPSAVDSRTLSQLTSLLDVMEGYRMIAFNISMSKIRRRRFAPLFPIRWDCSARFNPIVQAKSLSRSLIWRSIPLPAIQPIWRKLIGNI